jgi:hypothetical protein
MGKRASGWERCYISNILPETKQGFFNVVLHNVCDTIQNGTIFASISNKTHFCLVKLSYAIIASSIILFLLNKFRQEYDFFIAKNLFL